MISGCLLRCVDPATSRARNAVQGMFVPIGRREVAPGGGPDSGGRDVGVVERNGDVAIAWYIESLQRRKA